MRLVSVLCVLKCSACCQSGNETLSQTSLVAAKAAFGLVEPAKNVIFLNLVSTFRCCSCFELKAQIIIIIIIGILLRIAPHAWNRYV